VPDNQEDEWSDSSLFATAVEFAGVGTDADLPDIDRFRAGVSRLAAKSLNQTAISPGQGLSVFVLNAAGPPASIADECFRVHMLERGRVPLHDRVWFVSHVVAAGSFLPVVYQDDDELFRFVTDVIGAGDLPTIVFDARDPDPELRFYPEGLVKDEVVERLQIAMRPISLDIIFGHIGTIHKKQLVTPGMHPRGMRLWANSREGTATSHAEDTIAALLTAGLHTALPNCRVRVEQPMPTGRLDIEIEERMPDRPGGVLRHAILELKVLRGRNPNTTRVSATRIKTLIEDGVEQAAAYREDKQALAAALCCFDMRESFTGRETFAHVLDLAKDVAVELRVWHLFMSAAAYRHHLRKTGALSKVRSAAEREYVS
jgi:hypothetical protein